MLSYVKDSHKHSLWHLFSIITLIKNRLIKEYEFVSTITCHIIHISPSIPIFHPNFFKMIYTLNSMKEPFPKLL
jgi:hypothetical protein